MPCSETGPHRRDVAFGWKANTRTFERCIAETRPPARQLKSGSRLIHNVAAGCDTRVMIRLCIAGISLVSANALATGREPLSHVFLRQEVSHHVTYEVRSSQPHGSVC